VLRSDEIRKRLCGVAPETRLPEEGYAEAVSTRVFTELASQAAAAVAGGQCVVADATFLDAAHRAQIQEAAGAAPFLGIWLTAPLAELERRVAGRVGDASDATVAVLRNAAARDSVPPCWRVVDATEREIATARLLDAGRTLGVVC
jgi:predicted kinase